jgi:hypothetical protein
MPKISRNSFKSVCHKMLSWEVMNNPYVYMFAKEEFGEGLMHMTETLKKIIHFFFCSSGEGHSYDII